MKLNYFYRKIQTIPRRMVYKNKQNGKAIDERKLPQKCFLRSAVKIFFFFRNF